MNAKLPQFIGEYQWIEGRRSILEVRVGSKVVTPAKEVILNNKNSLFVDLEVVQRLMVMFYGMSVAGIWFYLFHLCVFMYNPTVGPIDEH